MKLKRIIGWGLLGLAILVLLLVAGAYIFLSRFDFSTLKPKIEAQAEAALGRRLELGDISVALSLHPAIGIENVRLANPEGASRPDMVSIGKIKASLALLPMLGGRIEAGSLLAEDIDVLLEETADGRNNWTFPASGKPEGKPAGDAGGGKKNGVFPDIGSIAARNIRVTLRRAGKPEEVFNLVSLDGSTSGKMELQAEGDVRGVPVSFRFSGGSMAEWTGGGGAWPVDAALDAGDARLAMKGTVPSLSMQEKLWMGDFSVDVSASGSSLSALSALLDKPLPDIGTFDLAATVAAKNGEIGVAGLSVKVGDGSLTGEFSVAPEEKALRVRGRLDIARMDLRPFMAGSKGREVESAGTVRPGKAGQFDMARLRDVDADLSVTASGITVPAGEIENLAAALRVADGKLLLSPFAFDYGGQRLSGAFNIDATQEKPPLSLLLEAPGARLSLSGVARSPEDFRLEFSASGQSLGPFAALSGASLPEIGAFSVSGGAEGKDGVVHLADFAAKIGGSDLAGDITAHVSETPVKLTAKITARKIDMADFLPEETPASAAEGGKAAGQDGGRIIPDVRLEIPPALAGVETELSANVALLKLSGVEMEKLVLRAKASRDMLDIDGLAFDIHGSPVRLEGSLTAAEGGHKLGVSGTAKQVDYGRLLKEAKTTDLVRGKVDVAFDLSGQGKSLHPVMKSLAGNVRVIAGAGEVGSANLDLWASDLAAAMLPKAEKAAKDITKVNCIVGIFDVKDGVAKGTDILMDTGKITVRGEGEIDLGDETLNLALVPKPKSASLISIAVPVNITGSWRKPGVAADNEGLAKNAAGVAATALGLVNPIGLVGMLASKGTGEDNPCAKYLGKGGK